MRILAIFVLSLLVLGCLSPEERANVTDVTDNVTQANQTMPAQWKRYNTTYLSFEHPANMEVQEASGIFTGTHDLDGQTAEILVVVYLDTYAAYGANKDRIFRQNPTKAASDFLIEDQEEDPAQLLSEAYERGNISTFAISRGAFVAEVPFRIRFSSTGPRYTGHALSLYVPERSLHVKFRVIALDPEIAEDIRDRFLLSFMLE